MNCRVAFAQMFCTMEPISYVVRFTCALLVWSSLLVAQIEGIGEVIWAVNCGGDKHTDIHGIRYQRDILSKGVASDYGKNLLIERVVPQDQILYQTERYHTDTFTYEVPIRQDGDYILVLKFSEVWFTSANQKVFDVVLNKEHSVVESLDIFGKVGRGIAHDEIIPFSVKNGKLKVAGETSYLDGRLQIDFVKGSHDNPKVNAIYVMRGTIEDVPKLAPTNVQPSQPPMEEEEEEEVDYAQQQRRKTHHHPPPGPKVPDPYASDDTSSMMLPVFVAIGAFVPLVFCLCKL